MSFIDWDDIKLNTGHPVIDEQHMRLVEIINELYNDFLSIQDNSLSDTFEKTLDATKDYVDYHFAAEEKIMTALNYPDKVAHIMKHRKFQQAISDLAYKLKSTDNPNVKFLTKKLLLLLKDWLINHIVEVDRNFIKQCAELAKNSINKK